MSLSKVPLIIGVCLPFKRCVTPPNPLPPKEERVHKANFPSWYTQKVPIYATSIQFVAGLLEILSIVAHHDPTSPLAKRFLFIFVFRGGNAGNLWLSKLNIVGGTMMIMATLLRLMTYRYLGKFFRFEASIQSDHKLVTGGPYSVVRHPSYTGTLTSHTGWFLWQFGQGSWVRESGLWNTALGKIIVGSYAGFIIVGSLIMVLRRMEAEDRALRMQFGNEWNEWADRVRYYIIPGIY